MRNHEISSIYENLKSNPQEVDTVHALSVAVNVIQQLDQGETKVAEKINDSWSVDENAKQAILIYFMLKKSAKMYADTSENIYFDKVPLKPIPNSPSYRVVPGAIIRFGAYIGEDVVIMPSFINIGAYIGSGSMIDSMVTIGSCAQIGENVHIGANTCIGGVLEPVNSNPVIIENGCFVGANCSITEGVIVEADSVISSGIHITASTKIIDTTNGNKILRGVIPSGSVVIPGSYRLSDDVYVNAAILRKRVDRNTIDKIGINEILRSA